MPDCSARLWISQADSDFHVATLLNAQGGGDRAYCQTIAKCQQAVEKSIKAVAAGLRDAQMLYVKNRSDYDHDVDEILSAMERLEYSARKKYYQEHLSKIMGGYYSGEIKALSSLAPRKPDQHNPLHARNTEYPYEIQQGLWTAPAAKGAFTIEDVQRFFPLADRVHDNCKKMVSVLDRLPKK
jgi:HEPN domain-containing protein